jgi:hypothetical protein
MATVPLDQGYAPPPFTSTAFAANALLQVAANIASYELSGKSRCILE